MKLYAIWSRDKQNLWSIIKCDRDLRHAIQLASRLLYTFGHPCFICDVNDDQVRNSRYASVEWR